MAHDAGTLHAHSPAGLLQIWSVTDEVERQVGKRGPV